MHNRYSGTIFSHILCPQYILIVIGTCAHAMLTLCPNSLRTFTRVSSFLAGAIILKNDQDQMSKLRISVLEQAADLLKSDAQGESSWTICTSSDQRNTKKGKAIISWL